MAQRCGSGKKASSCHKAKYRVVEFSCQDASDHTCLLLTDVVTASTHSASTRKWLEEVRAGDVAGTVRAEKAAKHLTKPFADVDAAATSSHTYNRHLVFWLCWLCQPIEHMQPGLVVPGQQNMLQAGLPYTSYGAMGQAKQVHDIATSCMRSPILPWQYIGMSLLWDSFASPAHRDELAPRLPSVARHSDRAGPKGILSCRESQPVSPGPDSQLSQGCVSGQRALLANTLLYKQFGKGNVPRPWLCFSSSVTVANREQYSHGPDKIQAPSPKASTAHAACDHVHMLNKCTRPCLALHPCSRDQAQSLHCFQEEKFRLNTQHLVSITISRSLATAPLLWLAWALR